MGGLPELLQQV